MLAFSVVLFAQEKKIVEFVEKDNTYDFGTVQESDGQGGRVSHDFTFKNVGTTPIFIVEIRPGCSCTASNFDKNKIILPGETGKFTISYTVAGRAGTTISRRIPITFKDGSDNIFTENVNIKGQVAAAKEQTQLEPVQQQQPEQTQKAQQMQKLQQSQKAHRVQRIQNNANNVKK